MKKVNPDFKQIKLELSLNVESDGKMRFDGSIRVDGKGVPMDKYSAPQLFGLYTLFENAVPPYYNACVQMCLERGIVKLGTRPNENSIKAEA